MVSQESHHEPRAVRANLLFRCEIGISFARVRGNSLLSSSPRPEGPRERTRRPRLLGLIRDPMPHPSWSFFDQYRRAVSGYPFWTFTRHDACYVPVASPPPSAG